MSYRYCPTCGTEYRSGVETCSDCLTPLVDEPPAGLSSGELPDEPGSHAGLSSGEPPGGPGTPTLRPLVAVFVTGRLSEAELVRSFLESHDIETRLWSSGLSPWRLEAAVTEVTGLANDFNAHRVMVEEHDAEKATRLLDEAEEGAALLDETAGREAADIVDPESVGDDAPPRTFLEALRTRWALVALAIILLVMLLLFGPPN